MEAPSGSGKSQVFAEKSVSLDPGHEGKEKKRRYNPAAAHEEHPQFVPSVLDSLLPEFFVKLELSDIRLKLTNPIASADKCMGVVIHEDPL